MYEADSGIGKSYVASLLRGYSVLHDNVLVMDSSDFDLEKLLSTPADLVVLDRCDQYLTKGAAQCIKSLTGTTILDVKCTELLSVLTGIDCTIDMYPEGFVIHDTLYI